MGRGFWSQGERERRGDKELVKFVLSFAERALHGGVDASARFVT
jgi:hypothetical protein